MPERIEGNTPLLCCCVVAEISRDIAVRRLVQSDGNDDRQRNDRNTPNASGQIRGQEGLARMRSTIAGREPYPGQRFNAFAVFIVETVRDRRVEVEDADDCTAADQRYNKLRPRCAVARNVTGKFLDIGHDKTLAL